MPRWLLLLAVAFGVVTMHHVPASADTRSESSLHTAQASHIAGPGSPMPSTRIIGPTRTARTN